MKTLNSNVERMSHMSMTRFLRDFPFWKSDKDCRAAFEIIKRRYNNGETTVTPCPASSNVIKPCLPSNDGKTVSVDDSARLAQSQFRMSVLKNFNGLCAVSGHPVGQALEAAHIEPYNVNKNNDISNGLSLDCSLRYLFDAGLMSINPLTMTVHFKCRHPLAALYNGNRINAHTVKLNLSALKNHWLEFNK